jgi:23S rRNA pseudouridine2605 synthase
MSEEKEKEVAIRLNKLIAMNGIASRRKADQMISEGAVMVDGEIVTDLGTKVDPTRQRVEIDGVLLKAEGERHRYYLLNKPSGVVCTNDAREARPRAIDLITDRRKGRIYTVGRLDEETTGLVILTSDGDFANKVSHPRHGVSKTYRAVVAGRVGEDELRKLRKGVHLSEFKTRFARVQVQKRSERQSTLIVSLEGGRNREVRRAFAHLGFAVKNLRRVAIGKLGDRGLKVGHWRPLTRLEVEGLLQLAEGKEAPPIERRGKRARAKKA